MTNKARTTPSGMGTMEAQAWVRTHVDRDVLDDDELEDVFRALYEREPDDDDRSTGLWSLCCAAVGPLAEGKTYGNAALDVVCQAVDGLIYDNPAMLAAVELLPPETVHVALVHLLGSILRAARVTGASHAALVIRPEGLSSPSDPVLPGDAGGLGSGGTPKESDVFPRAVAGGHGDGDLIEGVHQLPAGGHDVAKELVTLAGVAPELDHQGGLASPLPSTTGREDGGALESVADDFLDGRHELRLVDYGAVSGMGAAPRLQAGADINIRGNDSSHGGDDITAAREEATAELDRRRRRAPSALWIYIEPVEEEPVAVLEGAESHLVRVETSWLSMDEASVAQTLRLPNGHTEAVMPPDTLPAYLRWLADIMARRM